MFESFCAVVPIQFKFLISDNYLSRFSWKKYPPKCHCHRLGWTFRL